MWVASENGTCQISRNSWSYKLVVMRIRPIQSFFGPRQTAVHIFVWCLKTLQKKPDRNVKKSLLNVSKFIKETYMNIPKLLPVSFAVWNFAYFTIENCNYEFKMRNLIQKDKNVQTDSLNEWLKNQFCWTPIAMVKLNRFNHEWLVNFNKVRNDLAIILCYIRCPKRKNFLVVDFLFVTS